MSHNNNNKQQSYCMLTLKPVLIRLLISKVWVCMKTEECFPWWSCRIILQGNILVVHHVIAAPWTETFHEISCFRSIRSTNMSYIPSLDFFLLDRVPPNFPRKDSSFFIFAVADVLAVPDIFDLCVCCVSCCVWTHGHTLPLSSL